MSVPETVASVHLGMTPSLFFPLHWGVKLSTEKVCLVLFVQK